MNLKSDFISLLKSQFQGLQNRALNDYVSENLLSPFKVSLPTTLLNQAQHITQALFKLRINESYISHYQSRLNEKLIFDPGNHAILMSYDFHVDEQGNLKLIEVNTNAAFLALGYYMYKLHNMKNPIADFKISNLKDCIENELKLFGQNPSPRHLAIIDDQPENQRLYIEFLVFNELFKSFGWQSGIYDFRQIPKDVNFIYNRYTDFYFEKPESANLKDLFLNKQCCFSPHPFEYFLLADKERLADWTQDGFLEKFLDADSVSHIRNTLLKSYELNSQNKDHFWSRRKSLFFKPKQEFGSKRTFKGSSISRKVFDELAEEVSLAQDYVAAPEIELLLPNGPSKFKYDLRFYVYEDQLQSVVARLYQGQVTNLKTPYGGFAPVEFT